MSALVSDEPAQDVTSNSSRRLALLIPLMLPNTSNGSSGDHTSSSSSNSLSNLRSSSIFSDSGAPNSRSRGVLLLVITVPNTGSESSTGFLGRSGFSSLDFLSGSDDNDEAFHDILNRLFQSIQPRGPPPAAKKAVDSLPIVCIDAISKEEAIRCPVCLLDWEIDEEATQLPCKHLFHQECINTWLKQANTCCVCRHQLPTEESEPETPSALDTVEDTARNTDAINIPEEMDEDFADLPELTNWADDEDLPNLEEIFAAIPDQIPELREAINQAQSEAIAASEVLTPTPNSPPRVLEDDLPPTRRDVRGRGPISWLRRRLSSVNCLQGFFS